MDKEITINVNDLHELMTFTANADRDELEQGFILLASQFPHYALSAIRGRTVDNEIKQMIRDGRKIAAIKALRDKTKMSLRDAKDAVERIADEIGMPFKNPGRDDQIPVGTTSLGDLLRANMKD